MSATPIRQLFQTMFNLKPEALEVEAEEDEDETPAMEPDSSDAVTASGASGATPSVLAGATGVTPGRGGGRGMVFGRRAVAGRSPERARRGGLARSPERPMNRARRQVQASSEESEGSAPSDPPTVYQLPGVRLNTAFRPVQRHAHRRRIVLHSTSPPEQIDNPQPIARPKESMRPLLGEKETTMYLPDNEYDPEFMILSHEDFERKMQTDVFFKKLFQVEAKEEKDETPAMELDSQDYVTASATNGATLSGLTGETGIKAHHRRIVHNTRPPEQIYHPQRLARPNGTTRPIVWERDHNDGGINLQGQSVPEAFVNNPIHFDLYRKALTRGFEIDKAIRVNVVGNFKQGKTSLTKILVGKTYGNVQSTNGVEINHCKYVEAKGDVRPFEKTSKLDDTGIIERIAEVAKNWFTDDEINLTEASEYRPSLELLSSLHPEECLDHKTESSNKFCSVYEQLFEDKEDNNNTSVLKTKGKEKKTKIELETQTKVSLTPVEMQKFSTCLTSDQSSSNVARNLEIWDFAGQFVFYATHTLFHSKRALYLLVFDLTTPLSEVVNDSEFPIETGGKTMEQFIKFWMNSIHSYVGSNDGTEPPVILVGTHKDKLVGDEIQKSNHADAYFERVRNLFEYSPILKHIQAKDFIVNSVDPNDKEIVELRKEIIRIGMKQSETKLPAKWIALEKELIKIRYMKIIPFSKVVEIDSQNDFPLKEEEQIKLFLIYHHTKGTLFFFDEEPISAYVVLDTQYLIDAFKGIVTSERFCKKEPQYRYFWNLLQQQGKLTMELIDRVWESNYDFLKHKKEILMFMQRHYIISEVKSFDENTGTSNGLGWYIVPIFLRDHSDNNTVIEFLKGKRQTSLRFLMLFQYTPVVQIVYCRLVAALVAKWSVVQISVSEQEKEFLLYENLGAFRLDSLNAGVVELQQNRIEMRVISLCTSRNVDSITADKFRRFAESVVISEFSKLRHSSTIQGKPFHACFRCNDECHGLNGSHEILQMETLKGKSIEPCLHMPVSHEIHPKQALSEWFEDISTIGLLEDCQVNEKQLSKIAQTIGYNWELLGSELDLSNAEINQISMDNQTSSMKIFKMLLKWEARQQGNATVNRLIQAMKSTKSLTVEWDEVMNIIEEIASTQDK